MNRRSSAQRAVRLAGIATVFVLLLVAISYKYDDVLKSHAQGPNGNVTHTANGNTETWRIDEPNVKQKVTPYPQITFRPGDRITMEAGGCVQTGGHGQTWKRYVNPSGPDADHFYHGLIWIPGVIGGPAATGVPPDPKRIVAYLGPNQSVTVPSGIDTRQLYLRLGYEDDGYGDNGYYSHDDGTQNQCRSVGNAYVVINIAHGASTPGGSALAPFDLVWDTEDDNGIPLNPKWGWQITHPGAFPDPNQCTNGPHKSPCTNWADVINLDTAEVCDLEQYEPFKDNSPPLYGVAGHANWAASTYVGRIDWETHSTPGTDDDYNFRFYPAGGAGLTDTRDNLETEFDSDETIDHFNTPWWNAFHKAVDNYSSDSEVSQLWFKEPDGTSGRYAIVTGLIGLEMCHGGSNELHPAWALAIRVNDSNPADEVWAMFVRRWGDEGFCSGDQHFLTDLPGDTYTFRLPWRPGASSVNVGSATTFQAASSTTWHYQWAQNQGVLVSFALPTPQLGPLGSCVNCNLINGELHLQWTGGQGPAPIPGGPGPASAPESCDKKCTSRESDCYELRTGNQTIYQRCVSQCEQKCQSSTPLAVHRIPVRPGTLAIRASSVLDPEKQIASLMTKMTPGQRSQIIAANPRPASYNAQPVLQGAVSRIQFLPRRAARPRRVQYKSVPDPNKRAKNQRIQNGLIGIFGKRTSR